MTEDDIKKLVRSVADPDRVDPFHGNSLEDMATLTLEEIEKIYKLGQQHHEDC